MKHVLVVLSGKGGVGKSTVAAQLSRFLAAEGQRVGVLDVDLCGPSMPRMFGCEDAKIRQSSSGWIPVRSNEGIFVMSIAFLLNNRNDAVIWRGPKKTAMIAQFIRDVEWPDDMDILVVDTPPGTSDEHMSVVESVQKVLGSTVSLSCVLVTTPQDVAVADVRREITFCETAALPILGLVENMAGVVCPDCGEINYVFKQGGGQKLCREKGLQLLARLPLQPQLGNACEEGSIAVDSGQWKQLAQSVMQVLSPPE
jgi:Mrp family chromosome partitioning ATPase